jgi:hypothetical protein
LTTEVQKTFIDHMEIGMDIEIVQVSRLGYKKSSTSGDQPRYPGKVLI